MRGVLAVLAVIGLCAPAHAETREVALPTRDGLALRAMLVKPDGPGPFPAIVALHGCGGLWNKTTGRMLRRETAWAKRWTDAGYAAIFPDSFTARGETSVCSQVERPILPQRERVRDAYDALVWLQEQSFVRPDRVAVFGWSHGGMTTLWSIAAASPGRPEGLAHDFAGAVAFYPGCVEIGKTAFAASAPLLIEIGADDTWTLPKSCLAMVEAAKSRGGAEIAIDVYPGAVHGFDQPSGSVHPFVTRNSVYKSGEKTVMVGPDPAAREAAIPRAMAWLKDVLDR